MGLFSRKNSKHGAVSERHKSLPAMANAKNDNSAQSSTNFTATVTTLPKPPDPTIDPVGYLRSIYAVRERCKLILEKAKKNQLRHFTVDMGKFSDTAMYVVSIIKVS